MGEVIHHNFTPRKPKLTRRTHPTGVIVKPMKCDVSSYWLEGNVAGFIASFVAFNPEFNPSLFGKQIREELGVKVGNDWTPPDAA